MTGESERALSLSHLGALDADSIAEVLSGARRVALDAGEVTHREGDDRPHLDLVVSGLARAFVSAPDGRTLTVRYCRPGALLGAVSLYARPFRMPATVQCLVATEFLALDPERVRAAARSDPRVAGVLLAELAERVSRFIGEIPGTAFASVRQRVARHILDLASETQTGPDLVAEVSQQALADAVGTAREVVVRILRELREEAIVETRRGGIVILDAERLLAQTYGVDAPGRADREWNPGS